MKWSIMLLAAVFVVQQECPSDDDDDTEPTPTPTPAGCDVAALDPYVQPDVWASPSDPMPGDTVVIHYTGALKGSSSLEIHYGFNGWNETQATGMTETYIDDDQVFYRDLSMTPVAGGFEVGIDIPPDGEALHFVFHDPVTDEWDNNNELDYHQSVVFPYIGPFLSWNDVVGPSDGVVVNWETSVPGLGVVEYGPSEALGACAVGDVRDTLHHVALTGLGSGREWYYRVYDSAGNASEIHRFSTASQDASSFKFAVMGDSQDNGEGRRWSDVAGELQSAHSDTDFLLNTGDMVNNDSPGQWWTFFNGGRQLFAERVFMPVMGNHDVTDWTSFLRYFDLPQSSGSETWYWFRYGEAAFLGLNSEDPDGFSSSSGSQYSFAADMLAGCGEGSSRSCAPVFALWHVPPYNAGVRHCGEQWTYRDVTELFDGVVDWAFSGHEHLYQRFLPVRYNSSAAPSGQYGVSSEGGVGYIVVPPAGNWPETELTYSGSACDDARNLLAYPEVGSETQVSSEIGFVTVEVEGTGYAIESWGMGDIDNPLPAHVLDSVSVQ